MTRGLPTTFLDALQEAADSRTQKPVWLFRVQYTDTLHKLVTSFLRPVTFGGETYEPRSIDWDEVSVDALGEEQGLDVTLGDADRFWKALGADFNARIVRIYRADRDHLGSAANVLRNDLVVDAYEEPTGELILHLQSFRSLLQKTVPSVRATRALFPGIPSA